jgi:nucleoside-diphosphate-sugar epimerase
VADEAMARVYALDAGVPSIGLRPYVVYGPGRDQGMTSGPTMAMLAAVRGEPFEIGFSGVAQYDYAPDVARAFVMAANADTEGAAVYNVPGLQAHMDEVVACIRSAVPGAEITYTGERLPFPPALEASGFDRDIGPFPRTQLAYGVAATVAHFRRTFA